MTSQAPSYSVPRSRIYTRICKGGHTATLHDLLRHFERALHMAIGRATCTYI